MKKFDVRFLFVGFLLFLCSCISIKPPVEIQELTSLSAPKRTVTSFSPALSCMDQMLLNSNVKTIYVAAAPIYDRSEAVGKAGMGANEILIGSILNMSQKSDAIRFVAFDNSTPNIASLQGVHPNNSKFRHPDFFIRGAITQIDSEVWSGQRGGSLHGGNQLLDKFAGSALSGSTSSQVKTITLDMHMGMIPTFQMLPGVSSNNSLSTSKESTSYEIDLAFDGSGLIYALDNSRATSLSSALRSLVEVGSIEMFGKLFNVPFWECLAVAGPSESDEKESLEAYKNLKDEEQRDFVISQLKQLGYVDVAVKVTEENLPLDLRKAIGKYRFENGMNATPKIDYRLFRALYLQSKVIHSEAS